MPDFWQTLAKMKEEGTWEGEIETHEAGKEIPLTKGEHYYIISDRRKRIVECISCPVKHGGILEAHLLTKYKIENGVLYYNDIPTNTTPAIAPNIENATMQE